MSASRTKLPRSGLERELLREKGQFWTPAWVAEAMIGYTIANGCSSIFDPAVGQGAFFHAAKSISAKLGARITLRGTEIDPQALQSARRSGLSDSDLAYVELRDFVLDPPEGPFEAIVANPPYIRHHRLSSEVKGRLKAFGKSVIGQALDGRAGYHVYFLLRALQLLDNGGRLVFIMPADTCEGVFAPVLWGWITSHYRLEAVVTFRSRASPFPDVDTNPVVFMIKNDKPLDRFLWVRCTEPNTEDFKAWSLSRFRDRSFRGLSISERSLREGLATGLSRPPCEDDSEGPVLHDYAEVRRGIATGANNFFFLTAKQAKALGIPHEFLIPAIGRTRDVPGDAITHETLSLLEAAGRPTLVFSPDDRPLEGFPKSVREYLEQGKLKGLDKRPLMSQRRPWYRMEKREVPPILFAYLGRRNARLLRNLADVVPLTCFLCVYPRSKDPCFVDKLWKVLQHPLTLANLPRISKSYGAGAIKAEPRALEKLPLPVSVIAEVGLPLPERAVQTEFCFDR